METGLKRQHLNDNTVANCRLAVNLADLSVTVVEVELRDLLMNLLDTTLYTQYTDLHWLPSASPTSYALWVSA